MAFDGVTVTLDKDTYAPGDTVTARVNGQASGSEAVPLSGEAHLTAEDGTEMVLGIVGTVQRPADLDVKITSVSGDRSWTISGDGKTATTTA